MTEMRSRGVRTTERTTATAIRNHGRTIEIRMIAPRMPLEVLANILNASPSKLSMVSMSAGTSDCWSNCIIIGNVLPLANRFIILPRGVLSIQGNEPMQRQECRARQTEERHWRAKYALDSHLKYPVAKSKDSVVIWQQHILHVGAGRRSMWVKRTLSPWWTWLRLVQLPVQRIYPSWFFRKLVISEVEISKRLT